MMTETGIGTVAVGSLLGLVACCFLWMLGGRSGKWKRRYAGSFVLALTVNLAALAMGVWDAWLLALVVTLALAFSMGYGGETTAEKVIRRTVFALGVLASGALCTLVIGGNAWMLLVPHVGVGLFSIWLGVKNPLHAAAEEVGVCFLLNGMLVFYPFIR